VKCQTKFGLEFMCHPLYSPNLAPSDSPILAFEKHTVSYKSDCRWGLDWRMDLLPRTTSNYRAIADLHTLQITTAQAKPQSFIFFLSHCLVTVLSNGDTSVSMLMPLPTG
jgi:hypothetical protein